jgi:hypothetical protein
MIRSSLFSVLILVSLLSVVSCANNTTMPPTTPSPSYSPSETTHITPTLNYILSETIKEKLKEVAQAFGRDIPIPTYLPVGYAISDARLIKKQDSYAQAELIITAPDKPDISLQIEWGPELWRLKPSADDYQYFQFNDGNGTYGSVVLNYLSDCNVIWWDWVPDILPTNGLQPHECYEMALSTNKEVPEEELVNIVRFVTIP